MNIGFNPNCSSMNCQKRNNTPNFGMAVKVADSAEKVIKEQVVKMSEKKANVFWEGFNGFIDRQAENPVNIIIRKCRHRNALAAEVVDSQAENAVKNRTFKQGIFSRNGSLDFTKSAEKEANKLNQANEKIADLPKATEADFYPGGIIPKKSESVVEVGD